MTTKSLARWTLVSIDGKHYIQETDADGDRVHLLDRNGDVKILSNYVATVVRDLGPVRADGFDDAASEAPELWPAEADADADGEIVNP